MLLMIHRYKAFCIQYYVEKTRSADINFVYTNAPWDSFN